MHFFYDNNIIYLHFNYIFFNCKNQFAIICDLFAKF